LTPSGGQHVLHVFQKKSKRGIATPQADLNRIEARLKTAQAIHAQWLAAQREQE